MSEVYVKLKCLKKPPSATYFILKSVGQKPVGLARSLIIGLIRRAAFFYSRQAGRQAGGVMWCCAVLDRPVGSIQCSSSLSCSRSRHCYVSISYCTLQVMSEILLSLCLLYRFFKYGQEKRETRRTHVILHFRTRCLVSTGCTQTDIHSSSLSYDRSKASSKASSPHVRARASSFK